MKYNRSLDLLAIATASFKTGDVATATRAFLAAAAHPSAGDAVRVISASNKKAAAPVRASVQKRRISASASWPFAIRAGVDLDQPNPGDDLRVDLDENGDRLIQEADFDDGLDDLGDDMLAGLDDDLGFDSDDGGDLVLSADEDGEDDKEDDKGPSSESASTRFARYLRNAAAIEAAAKKKKKPARR